MDLRELLVPCTRTFVFMSFQIMEGLITVLLGVVMWFLIPDFPDRNDFLTNKQTALVLKRIEDDRGDATPDPVTFQIVKQHLSDWTIWSCGEHLFSNTVKCQQT